MAVAVIGCGEAAVNPSEQAVKKGGELAATATAQPACGSALANSCKGALSPDAADRNAAAIDAANKAAIMKAYGNHPH